MENGERKMEWSFENFRRMEKEIERKERLGNLEGDEMNEYYRKW